MILVTEILFLITILLAKRACRKPCPSIDVPLQRVKRAKTGSTVAWVALVVEKSPSTNANLNPHYLRNVAASLWFASVRTACAAIVMSLLVTAVARSNPN